MQVPEHVLVEFVHVLGEDDPKQIPSLLDDSEVRDFGSGQHFIVFPDVVIFQDLFDIDPSSFVTRKARIS